MILIVEDEAAILILTESVLQSAGHETVTAATLTEAEAVIASDTSFDLVFTDIHLKSDPEGGIHIGRLVAEKRPRTPVLYTSGRNVTDGLKELMIERSAFLPKPYTDHELFEAIERLLKRYS